MSRPHILRDRAAPLVRLAKAAAVPLLLAACAARRARPRRAHPFRSSMRRTSST